MRADLSTTSSRYWPRCRAPASAPATSSPLYKSAKGRSCSGPSAPYTSGMERKLATVLFVDLVDHTDLVTGADPEVVRRRITTFFEGVARCIETHGGTVEKFAGDAVMAAFGIPQAHEDDAERAIRAALAIIDHVRELALE